MSPDTTLRRHDTPLSCDNPRSSGNLRPDQLLEYRSVLVAQWRQQVANIVELSYEMHSPIADESDADGSRGNRLDVTARLLEAARHQLQETEAALARVDDGSYGSCDRCREPIPAERLTIVPAARCCVACQALTSSRR